MVYTSLETVAQERLYEIVNQILAKGAQTEKDEKDLLKINEELARRELNECAA